jgi:membrane protease YdiL (CAAX protease family)
MRTAVVGCQEDKLPGWSRTLGTIDKHREMLFWLLLLGSWQFLASARGVNVAIGAAGTVAFLLFAARSLGRLRRIGMAEARWEPASRAAWAVAVASGFVSGVAVFTIASIFGQALKLSYEGSLVMLQVTLGPVLKELVFRGYLFALLAWSYRQAFNRVPANWAIVITAAVVFALVHLAQPGVRWLQVICIVSTGTLYSWHRCRSGSTAPAAASHAAYNLTLYAAVGIMGAGR